MPLTIVSWNVNGIRSILCKKKDGSKHTSLIQENSLAVLLDTESPDIVCLQEIRCSPSLEIAEKLDLNKRGYNIIGANCSKVKAGYSGTLTFAKQSNPDTQPISIIKDFPRFSESHELNGEGRIITVEFPKFVLINTYVPNAKPDLSRLKFRTEVWEVAMRQHINDMKKKYNNKPIILCGDMNVAPQDIDVHNPKTAKGKHGFTIEEREAFVKLLGECDMKDAFREMYPDKVAYSWWSNFAESRKRNKGWQIDKFVVSAKLIKKVNEVFIKDEYFGSDHAPVVMSVTNI